MARVTRQAVAQRVGTRRAGLTRRDRKAFSLDYKRHGKVKGRDMPIGQNFSRTSEWMIHGRLTHRV